MSKFVLIGALPTQCALFPRVEFQKTQAPSNFLLAKLAGRIRCIRKRR
jgi:hypothetical protein